MLMLSRLQNLNLRRSLWTLGVLALSATASAQSTSVTSASASTPASTSTSTSQPADSTWDRVSSAIRTPLLSTVDSSRFRFSGELTIDTSRSLGDAEHVAWDGFYHTNLAMKDNVNQFTYSLDSAFSQSYSYQNDAPGSTVGTDGDFAWNVLSVTRYWEEGRNFESRWIDRMSVSLSGGIPLGVSVGKTYFEGSIGPSIAVSKKVWRLSLGQSLSYSRGFYQYDIRNDGTINKPDVFKSKTALGFDLTDSLSVGLLYLYTEAIDFNGIAKGGDTTYLTLGYKVSKMFSLSAGVATDRASTLDPNGQTEQLKFYEQENAAAYFDVTLDF